MYWTKLRLSGLQDVDLPVVGASPTDMFVLKNADLGPSEVDVSISRTPHQGGVYQNRQSQGLLPVIRIGLNPDYSIGETPSDLRNYIYGLLSPGVVDHVVLKIMLDDEILYQVIGWVSKPEMVPFVKDPEVQITMNCLQAYYEGPEYVEVDTSDIDKVVPTIPYSGVAESGFEMEIEFTSAISSFTFTRFGTTKKMHFVYDFHDGDLLAFGTQAGNRYAHVTRGSDVIDLMHAMSTDSEWLQLFQGSNSFSTSDDIFDWSFIKYLPKIWGV